MARSISEIKNTITAPILANATLVEFLNLDTQLTWEEHITQGLMSKTSFVNIIVFIVASAVWILEVIFDDHKTETNEKLMNQKVHTLRWYEQTGLAFQYGHTLPDIIEKEEDTYDNTNRSDEEVEASKVVKKVSVNKLPANDDNDIQMKVAGAADDGNLIQLSNDPATPYYDAFKAYCEKVFPAGVYIEYVNRVADKLKIALRVYYDPLILNATGNPLTGGDSEPVRETVLAYLKSGIDFNGVIVLNDLTDKLQLIDGVPIPEITNAQYEAQDGSFLPLITKHQPFSGYFTTEETENDELITEEVDEGTWTRKGFLEILYIPNV
jgi:hypothetical protein